MDIKRKPTSIPPSPVPPRIPLETPAVKTPSPAPKHKSKRWIWLVVVLATLVALTSGYFVLRGWVTALIQNRARSLTGNVKIDQNNGVVTVKDARGNTFTTESKLPNGFPSDVFVYPDATIKSALQNGTTTVVSIVAKDAINTVSDRYASELAKANWQRESSQTYLGNSTYTTYNKDNRRLTIQISVNNNKPPSTNVVLTVSGK